MSPAPVPRPDESVPDMHAYAAQDYAANQGARDRDGHRDTPPATGFTVTTNPYSGEQIVRPFPR